MMREELPQFRLRWSDPLVVSDKLLDCSALGAPFVVVVGDAKHHALCFKIGDCFRECASFLRAVEPVLRVVDRTGRPVLVSLFPS